MSRSALVSFASLVIVAQQSVAANQVIVVTPGIGSTPIQNAVNAASDGDVIYVPTYTAYNEVVVVDNKSLTLVQETPPEAGVGDFNRLRVQNLSAGKRVVVRGFTLFASTAFFSHETIILANNQGTVVLEDIIARPTTQSPAPTIRIQNCASVVLDRCRAWSTDGFVYFSIVFPPRPVIHISSSNVFAYDCEFEAGDGVPSTFGHLFIDPPLPGGPGAPAFQLESSNVFLGGGTITGGKGGANGGTAGNCLGAGAGAPAVTVLAGSNVVRTLGATVSGGAGGNATTHCPGGIAAPAIDPAATSLSITEPARTLELPPYLREGQLGTLTATGVPGEVYKLLFSLGQAGFYVPGLQGALLPGLPVSVVIFGPLPANGVLEVPLVVAPGSLPPTIEGLSIFAQGLVEGANGLGVLTSPSTITLVQTGF